MYKAVKSRSSYKKKSNNMSFFFNFTRKKFFKTQDIINRPRKRYIYIVSTKSLFMQINKETGAGKIGIPTARGVINHLLELEKLKPDRV